jgi:Pou domain - N-terminal to homeobox domain
MACSNISGKRIREYRIGLNMTQPQCAKFLSQRTGEVIDSKTLCRMENFGARDACHPMPPTPAVNELICPCVQ